MTNYVLADLELVGIVSFNLSENKKTIGISEERDIGFTYVANRVRMSQLIKELVELRDQMKPI
jgi:hypothetical protein